MTKPPLPPIPPPRTLHPARKLPVAEARAGFARLLAAVAQMPFVANAGRR
jgi:hypothetical protein